MSEQSAARSERWRDTILQYITAHPDRPMKARALARELDVPDDAYAEFRSTVRGLVQRGTLVYARNRTLRLPGTRDAEGPTGIFRLYRRGFGTVRLESGEEYFIPRARVADAHDGDRVLVRPLRRAGRMGQPAAAVVRVLQRASQRWIGILERRGQQWLVQPRSHVSAPLVEVEAASVDPDTLGQLVVIEPLGPGSQARSVRGTIIEVLGDARHSAVKVRAVALAAGLPERFPDEAAALADTLAERFDVAAALADREDLRATFTITIDPPDARDFDDAISIEPLADGACELGVHIADVAHFVSPGSALDEVARARGNSVYLPGMVVAMLPEPLSNNLCSLRPGEERLTRSAFIRYDGGGHVLAARFANTVIRSDARLTYQEVSAALEPQGPALPGPVMDLLRQADRLARRIRKRRFKEGMLSLNVPEVEIAFDEHGCAVDAGPADASFSHTIIEMFMVEANEAVARALTRQDLAHIRRIHPPPDEDGLTRLQTTLAELGVPVSGPLDRHALQRVLDAAVDTPRAMLINFLLLRALSQAEYAVSEEGHYALASQAYCHFTSPIRRYPDLTVHRQLDAVIRQAEPDGNDRDELKDTARRCNDTERRAVEAERDARKWLLTELMAQRVGETFDGVVTGVVSAGIFVQAQPYLAEGFIPVADFGDDRWEFDREAHRFLGLRTGRQISIGLACRITVARVDEIRGDIDFVPASGLGTTPHTDRKRPPTARKRRGRGEQRGGSDKPRRGRSGRRRR